MAAEILSQEQKRRKAALHAMDDFADAHGCIDRNWREEDEGDSIRFFGTAGDGRRFSTGYVKDDTRG